MERKLAAILAADVVGYTGLMAVDEAATLQALNMHRRELIDPKVSEHGGRIVKLMGDGVLIEFPSVVKAVQCAVEVQRGMAMRNLEVEDDRRIEFRVGINLGDVIVEDDDIYGDGVNVAARLEGLADPGGICVSRNVRNQVRDKLPYQFESIGEQRVKGVARPVRIFRVGLDEPDATRARGPNKRTKSRPVRWRGMFAALAALVALTAYAGWSYLRTLPVQSKPSIAVLPFKLQGDAKNDEYFADGISEDITSALSRFSNLVVMSRNAVFAYKEKHLTPEALSKELRVRYLVTGSVRKVGNRVRVSAQLNDANSSVVLWSERYDEELIDIFSVQDKITQSVAGSLVGRLNIVEEARALARPTNNPRAYDLTLRGRSHFHKLTRSENFKARKFFERAIALEPDYATAYVWLARTHINDAVFGWSERNRRSLLRGFELAQKAIVLDPTSGVAHSVVAEVYTYRQRDDLAAAEAEKAIELNPNHAAAHAVRGAVYLSQGNAAMAITYLETARRFNPQLDPGLSNLLAIAYYLENRSVDAVNLVEGLKGRYPEFPYFDVTLAVVHARAGETQQAEHAVQQVYRKAPFFPIEEFAQQYLHKTHRGRFLKDGKAAGF